MFGKKGFNLPVFLTLVLLAGLATETLSRPRPKDADGYHAKVFQHVHSIPMTIGAWRGEDMPEKPAAIALLRPNAFLHRRYVDTTLNDPRPPVDFLFVQCRDARDMQGHYPPVCYPAHGYSHVSDEVAQWQVGERTIIGMEYSYSRTEGGVPTSCVVSNLLILPTGQYARGMDEVREAAADYLRHFYGAAQVQIVMDARVAREQRDEVVREFLGAIVGALDSLTAAPGGKL